MITGQGLINTTLLGKAPYSRGHAPGMQPLCRETQLLGGDGSRRLLGLLFFSPGTPRPTLHTCMHPEADGKPKQVAGSWHRGSSGGSRGRVYSTPVDLSRSEAFTLRQGGVTAPGPLCCARRSPSDPPRAKSREFFFMGDNSSCQGQLSSVDFFSPWRAGELRVIWRMMSRVPVCRLEWIIRSRSSGFVAHVPLDSVS